MISYPKISPEIFSIGPLKLRWYGLMYVIGFIIGYQLIKQRARQGLMAVRYAACESLISHLIVGMLVGARVVYCVLYNWEEFSQNPLDLFKIWQGGLSFHGAAIGMIIACAVFARKHLLPFYSVTDTLAYTACPGLFFGRLGNFINGELYGRPTDVGWAMIFPHDALGLPRHPSQLYEAVAEGLMLFLILYGLQKTFIAKGKYRHGIVGGSFLVGYGIFRFLVEYTREPDAQLGLYFGDLLSMGQILCALMILAGLAVLRHAVKSQPVFRPSAQSEDFLNS